jgi:CDP-paratose 2-epimerase
VSMKWIVTGAAGFVGTNLSLKLAELNHDVLLIDDLSRPFVDENKKYLEANTSLVINKIDITDFTGIRKELERFGNADIIVNLAGQVSLLASIKDPMRDFVVNAHAPLMLLEYFRENALNPIFINLSSNKVYGDLKNAEIVEDEKRYSLLGENSALDESTPLDFYGPYGCSKGSADQYLIDYSRIYGMRTVSFRQSTIYGPFQRPTSDQGWVVYMIDQILKGELIHLNGIGKQVRDILYVSDLIELFLLIPQVKDFPFGQAFNVGGGPKNTLSILELFALLELHTGLCAKFRTGQERPGDQKYYVSNVDKIFRATGWRPSTDVVEGVLKVLDDRNLAH